MVYCKPHFTLNRAPRRPDSDSIRCQTSGILFIPECLRCQKEEDKPTPFTILRIIDDIDSEAKSSPFKFSFSDPRAQVYGDKPDKPAGFYPQDTSKDQGAVNPGERPKLFRGTWGPQHGNPMVQLGPGAGTGPVSVVPAPTETKVAVAPTD